MMDDMILYFIVHLVLQVASNNHFWVPLFWYVDNFFKDLGNTNFDMSTKKIIL